MQNLDQSEDTVPIVYIVGTEGYAAQMVRAAERAAAAGTCRLGGVVVDPSYVGQDRHQTAVRDHSKRGWHVFDSTDALFSGGVAAAEREEELHLAVLPVPIHLHAPLTMAAMEAGFHVLCEKPAAGSLDDLTAMEEAARRFRRYLWFGFQHPLNHAFAEALRRVEAGDAGTISAITCSVGWPRDESYYCRAPWAGRLRLDGRAVLDSPIQNAAAHFLHGILELAFRAGFQATSVTAEHARTNAIETADFQGVRIRTVSRPGKGRGRSGPELLMTAAHSCREIKDPVITVHGDRKTIRWRFPDTVEAAPSGGDHSDGTWKILRKGDGTYVNDAALKGALAVLAGHTDTDVVARNLVGVEGARRHLEVVEAAFFGTNSSSGIDATFTVPEIPRHFIHIENGTAGVPQHEIVDIEQTMDAMMRERLLPSELDVPWKNTLLRVEGTVYPRRVVPLAQPHAY